MRDASPFYPCPEDRSGEALRAALHQAADAVADYLCDLGGSLEGSSPIQPPQPAAPEGGPDTLLPEEPVPLADSFQEAVAWARRHSVHLAHPRYFGHMDSGVALAGILGDLLASALNQNLLAAELAPGATRLERALVDLFAREAGLPATASGVLTTGGTGANLYGLLLARDRALPGAGREGLTGAPPLAILCSAEAHYSLAKAAAVLGLGSDQIIPVPVEPRTRRLDPAGLETARSQARERGLHPVALVATAGTTACGAVDPLEACAEFARREGLWLHVDAALGGALLLHRRLRRQVLAGIERADSIGIDPHKWLYVPKCAGVFLVRDGSLLRPADYEAPYLDRLAGRPSRSQGRRSLDGSRRFDALKVWLTLRHLGRRRLEEILESRLRLAKWLHARLEDHPFFEARHEPDLNVLAFGPRDPRASEQVPEAQERVEAGGRYWSSLTRVEGRPSHRVVLLNPGGDEAGLEGLLAALEEAHRQLPRPPRPSSQAQVTAADPTTRKASDWT